MTVVVLMMLLAVGSRAAVAQQCQEPDREASFAQAVIPVYPQSAQVQNRGDMTVLVRVVLDNSGTVMDARVAQSSNDAPTDGAALAAARESRYLPKILNCTPVGARIIFRADFSEDTETVVTIAPDNPPGIFSSPRPG